MLKIAEVEANKGAIVTLGIKPTKPETGYGYIQLEDFELEKPTKSIRFMEKPNYETATQYTEQGNYVWNSGMFIFNNSVMMEEINTYLPNHHFVIKDMTKIIKDYTGVELANITKHLFARFERISIDFAVMEKSKKIRCIPVDFGWNDIGGFNSLEEVFDKDDFYNIVKNANYIQIDSNNNIVISNNKNRLITSIGVSNMIIVDTDEALLICDKSDAQRIKELLKKIV
jgi:mannose-1-phosphate guanylyltransferase